MSEYANSKYSGYTTQSRYCSDKTLRVFEQDVSEYLGSVEWAVGDAFGRNLNNDDWARFLEDVRTEIERRKGE